MALAKETMKVVDFVNYFGSFFLSWVGGTVFHRFPFIGTVLLLGPFLFLWCAYGRKNK